MCQVAATSRDDTKVCTELSLRKPCCDTVVKDRTPGRQNDWLPTGKELLASAGICCLTKEIEKGIDVLHSSEDSLESLNATQRQTELLCGACDIESLLEGTATRPAANNANLKKDLQPRQGSGPSTRVGEAFNSSQAVDQAIEIEIRRATELGEEVVDLGAAYRLVSQHHPIETELAAHRELLDGGHCNAPRAILHLKTK